MPEYPFWLGGIAASMAATCTHPLDVTKVRMQTLEHDGVKRPSTIHIIHSSIKQSGVRSLYTGLSASLMRQMSYSLVRLGSYERIKEHMSKDGRHFSFLKSLLAASVAGGLGGLVGNPADVLFIRMTSDIVRPPEGRYNYSNAISGLVSLVREEGFKGLTTGIGTNMFRAVLMNASQVGSYEFCKANLLSKRIPGLGYQLQDNLVLHLISSTLAGTFATTVCSPADVVRSRVMASSEGLSPAKVLVDSLRQEGIRFLFKGWTPAFIRLAPNTILLFVFYEQIKRSWKSTFISN
ncbi:dicarboxylic acid transporter [Coprinopsis marcescibilis]|uniref:Dicarboxylic acid transporter n=1 Tax=Coprinopsis marcescibilis TaxID=230819 RepID=A0A5C3LCZ4_COPMA|nr:dicarboxylic acid transporter [Coprinopsis marcescibilis]